MRVLFLSSWFPAPPINGAKIRVNNLLRTLARAHEVTLVAFVNTLPWAEAEREMAGLRDICREVIAAPRPTATRLRAALGYLSPQPQHLAATYNPGMHEIVRQQSAKTRFDVVVASEVGPAMGISGYADAVVGVPRILDGLEVGLFLNGAALPDTPRRKFRRYLTRLKYEPYLRKHLRLFVACTVPSAIERGYVSRFAPSSQRLEVMPHGLDLDHFYPRSDIEAEPNTLVYSGSLSYFPNRDAVERFLNDILPQVWHEAPEAKFRVLGALAGFDPEPWQNEKRVDFSGLLRDVRPHLWSSWMSVVPLRFGAGTRLKIIESMALGTPVVSTSKGAEGLEVTHGENILIADDPRDFAEQTVRLLRDRGLRDRLARNGRRLVEAKYDWASIGARFNQLVEEVAAWRASPSR